MLRFAAGAIAIMFVGLLAGGCLGSKTQVPPTTLPPAPPLPATGGEGVLGPMDLVEVRVYGEEDLTGEYQVESDGTLNFPLIGSVQVNGLTPTETSKELARLLEDGYLKSAVVTLRVVEVNSRLVTVHGHVKEPGSFPFTDGMTIIQAIAMAGGLDDEPAANRTTITRQEDGEPVIIRVPYGDISKGRAPATTLLPNDVIFVPESPI